MSQNVLIRLSTQCIRGFVNIGSGLRLFQTSAAVKDEQFDVSLLQFLVCPLSKKPLRYEETTNELINDEHGIAYPILDGIPNMIPQDARLIKKTEGTEEPTQS
ncbi:protein preY, mitochondrial-like [Trichomycterus rosablanca]|uniref:protein preY, mitochondrial-like n=1 Tax=Trichomycterus rosablanca TaxID=2290929 RepID=UPI002F3567B4